MKVIDLLNKIAKGEGVPNKIKWNGYVYEIDELENYYVSKCSEKGLFERIFDYFNDSKALNCEVEIIEEDKKIDKLDVITNGQCDYITIQSLAFSFQVVQLKINELIDEVNKLKEKK